MEIKPGANRFSRMAQLPRDEQEHKADTETISTLLLAFLAGVSFLWTVCCTGFQHTYFMHLVN